MAYNDIINHVDREENEEGGIDWKFRTILGHQHTPVGHPDRTNSNYNIQVSWETGAISTESLEDLAKVLAVDLAIYGKRNHLLEKESWKRFKHIAKREQHLICLVKQAKLRSFRTIPKFKYCFEVPRSYKHALKLDELAGNHLWRDANILEHKKLAEYDVFVEKFNLQKVRYQRATKR